MRRDSVAGMLRTLGLVLLLSGLAAALAGLVWSSLWPHPDANIGAGLLVVVGLPVAGVGAVLAVVGIVVGRRTR